MNRLKNLFVPLFFIPVFLLNCSGRADLEIRSQTGGPWMTHSYLLVDRISGEAAMVDPGPDVDSLTQHLDSGGLELKYILITHGHQDHVAGVPGLLIRYPGVKLCYSETEYGHFPRYADWRNLFQPQMVQTWQADSSTEDLMNLDYAEIPPPHIPADENTELSLGHLRIQVCPVPGHSRGSVCFIADSALFSGDLILYHSVGVLDYELGSTDDLVTSVNRLYDRFPDETAIYPGHGPESTIGFEKMNNRAVKQNED